MGLGWVGLEVVVGEEKLSRKKPVVWKGIGERGGSGDGLDSVLKKLGWV